jgi:hypothetical protein
LQTRSSTSSPAVIAPLNRNRPAISAGGGAFAALSAPSSARIRDCYKQGIETIGWQKWCVSVGIDRKSAERYEKNWRTVIDAPQIFLDAANREGLDLHQPRIADNLRIILVELAGREPSEAELPELLTRLDQPAPKPPKNKTGGHRDKPKSIAAARQSFSKVIANIPEKEMENADPLFHTFASVPPTAQMSVVVRSLFWQFVRNAPTDQLLSIAEAFVEAAQAELDSIREQLNRPTDSVESTGELAEENLNQAEPSREPIVDDQLPSSELNAEPVSELVAEPPAKSRRKLLLEFDDEHDVLLNAPAVGERKLVASETFDESFVDSLAASL